MSTFTRILSELSDPTGMTDGPDSVRHDYNPFTLADLAGCYSPDATDSPGARFLAHVARDVAEYVEDGTDTEDAATVLSSLTEGDGAHEIADNAVPVYTHERWQAFVDLGAYNEDVTDYGVAEDLTNAAGVALYIIAERLVTALAEELSEALSEDDEDDEEQDREPSAADEEGWTAREDDARGHVLS